MKLYLLSFLVLIISPLPNIELSRYDVRENFLSCYNNGYNQEYQYSKSELIEDCYTNFQIQFSIFLTDKICRKTGNKELLSPMNLISCMKIDDVTQVCDNLQEKFFTYEKTIDTLNTTIKFINQNKINYLKSWPYYINKNRTFPECIDYDGSINITIDQNVDQYDETIFEDFKTIKYLLYTEGPLLAILNTPTDIYTEDSTPFYKPYFELPKDGFKYFRVIGWQTINEKLYWIFTYTLSSNWGLNNYRLIEQGKYELKFINIKLS